MAYEFMSLAEVEALSEVPENATVLAEVGGSIKRIPGNGLGGGKSLIITHNPPPAEPIDAIDDKGIYFSANMTFEEAFELFNNHELAGACMYIIGIGRAPTLLRNIYLLNISKEVGMSCLAIINSLDDSGDDSGTLFWLSSGFTTIYPGKTDVA